MKPLNRSFVPLMNMYHNDNYPESEDIGANGRRYINITRGGKQ